MGLLYLALLPVVVLLYGIHRYVLDKRYRLPPGPTPVPFLGNTLAYGKYNKSWDLFSDLSKKYGPVITFYVGHTRFIVLNRVDVIQEAIVSQAKLFSDRATPLLPAFNAVPVGIVGANGKAWQHRRRFSLKAMRDFGMGKMAMVEKIHEEAHYFLAEIEKRASQPFEPKLLLSNVVSNVICSLVFGKRFEYDDPTFQVFVDEIYGLITRPPSRQFIFFALPFIHHFMTPTGIDVSLKMQNRISGMLREAIKERRRDFDPENIRDFPDVFIHSEMSPSKGADEALDFEAFSLTMTDMFIAGTETTSTLLGWTLLYLCKFPEIQAKCQQAIDSVIESDRLPNLTDRPKLVYIDAVMCEVLRKSSIAPLALFHAIIDGDATVNGHDIPARSVVVYNVWAVHHDETYWKDPLVFNPDRWIDSNGNLVSHSHHFMPFGIGPRICLGELLARMEFFVFAVSLLQRFTFSLADRDVSMEDGIPGITHGPPKFKLIATKR